MIRVTVELVSAVDASRNEVLGVATISNDGVRHRETGGARADYDVVLSKRGAKVNEIWKRGRVTKFNRKRFGGWDLVYLALKAVVGDRNS